MVGHVSSAYGLAVAAAIAAACASTAGLRSEPLDAGETKFYAAPLAVARRTAAQLQVSRGWDRETIRGAGIGAGLGAIAGAVWGGVTASKLQSCRTPHLIDVCSMEWYERAARGGMIGAAVGGAIGAALGYTVKKERWGVSVAPGGRGLELSVAF